MMESAAATSDYILHEVLAEQLAALGRTLGIQDAAFSFLDNGADRVSTGQPAHALCD